MDWTRIAQAARGALTRLFAAVPFNPGKRNTQIGVAIIVVLFVAGLATTCRGESYVQFGVGSTILRGETSVIDLAVVNPNGPGDSSLLFGATLIGESTLYGLDMPPQIAWRAQIIEGFGRFDVGLGVAWMRNTDIYNCSGPSFALSLEYRFKALPITASALHFSNAGSCRPNKGRDMVTVSWAFR
jgi:hypothetical protein